MVLQLHVSGVCWFAGYLRGLGLVVCGVLCGLEFVGIALSLWWVVLGGVGFWGGLWCLLRLVL